MLDKLRSVFVFGVSIVALACTCPASAQDQLIVAGTGGTTGDAIRSLFPAFEAEHNVKITYVTGNGSELLAKLQAAQGNQEVDVVMMDDGPMFRAIELGLCSPIEGVDLSNINEGAKVFPENRALGTAFIGIGLIYNKDVFAQKGWAPPTSWRDLEDPKYTKQFVIPPLSNGLGLMATIMLARVNGGGESNIDPGFDALINHVNANVLVYEPTAAKTAEQLQTGQASLAVFGHNRAKIIAESGFPVEFVYPKEGFPVIMPAICPVAKPKVSPAAQAYIKMILSHEAQEALVKAAGYAPVALDVKAGSSFPTGENAPELINVDWVTINKNRDAWNQRWVREVER